MRKRSARTRSRVLASVGLAAAAAATWWFWPAGRGDALARGGVAEFAGGTDATNAEVSQDDAPMRLATQGPAGKPAPAPPPPDEILKPRRARDSGGTSGAPEPEFAAASLDASNDHVEPDAFPQPLAAEEPPAAPRGAPSSENPAVRAALARHARGESVAARGELNRLLHAGNLAAADAAAIRQALRRIADETVFSRRAAGAHDDPLLETHEVRAGDSPNRIGAKYRVPGEAVMLMNGITDPTKLRLGQRLVVPRESFHARISKSAFRLDLYLGDTFVRSYPVGLGTAQSTPEGLWRVKDRLANPTYYPPASATDKRIIPPHDPKNPLGVRWIGLEGIEGDAVGRDGYGIHGTIEPESIGRNASLGCVRMHNDDVIFVYALLQPGVSTVRIVP
ncbi:MAG: L,D-transpeptidase family protein [Phycisphaerae bacterium]|nr:L,D-transpeptidase family protein [Phycisphaerae bacterium]MCZ2400657.1 L,D-transpeptidase family protein [Phycisphaerae bacterium]